MSLVLRFIGTYMSWEKSPEDKLWLQVDEIPADPLSDLNTKNNELSIYILKNGKSDLDRFIAAFATSKSRGYVREIDYLVFEEELIDEAGLKYRQEDSKDLIDEKIKKLHWNLYQISSQKLLELAQKIFNYHEVNTLSIDQVCQIINNSIKNGWINENKINNGINRDMEKYC